MFKLGLIVNPFAGVGGPLGLKGSDGEAVSNRAQQEGLIGRSSKRATEALRHIQAPERVCVYCYSGVMGEKAARDAKLSVEVIGRVDALQSTAEDTVRAAKELKGCGVDLLVFVGGDGTARDICRALGSDVLVLGIPAGVKMHSGVYAISPQGAGEVINMLISARLVDVGLAEVRDIDEEAFRQGVVKSRFYGELLVPREGRFLQQTKSSGREVEELVLADIGADIVESLEAGCLYLVGPGTTPQSVMQTLNLDNSLLGVDAFMDEALVALDLDEKSILALISKHSAAVKIIVTAIGGQGHIFGRGNQQFSPAVIRAVGVDNVIVLATKTKIVELEGRPLLVDTNDPSLDELLGGYRQVITGYHDTIVYPVGYSAEKNSEHHAASLR